jgi:hypothetical protein
MGERDSIGIRMVQAQGYRETENLGRASQLTTVSSFMPPMGRALKSFEALFKKRE